MAYRARMRGESNVRGHATGKNHYPQFIQNAIRAVISQMPAAVRAGNDFHGFVGKERCNFVNSVVDDVLKQLAGQLMNPVTVVREQRLSKAARQVVAVITLDMYGVA